MARVTAGVAVGGAIGGAVGSFIFSLTSPGLHYLFSRFFLPFF